MASNAVNYIILHHTYEEVSLCDKIAQYFSITKGIYNEVIIDLRDCNLISIESPFDGSYRL